MINSEPDGSQPLEPIVQSGARGALTLAGIATAVVIVIWLAFYLFVFAPRAMP